MTFHSVLSIVAAILGVISFFPYFSSIFRGETKPQRATYGIWSFIGIVEVGSYVASGARATVLLPLVYLIGEIAIFVLSFKRGMGGTNKLDFICLAGALMGIIGWVVTNNPHVALYLSIFASLCGFIPTVKKTYFLPRTESALSWGIAGVAATLNLLAVPHLELYLIVYPLYTFVFDGAEALLTLFPRLWRKQPKRVRL
jgi:hypothetical protein